MELLSAVGVLCQSCFGSVCAPNYVTKSGDARRYIKSLAHSLPTPPPHSIARSAGIWNSIAHTQNGKMENCKM
jgi:hypothetical protein